jgi:Type IV secretion-system coupling protein DNA-binding domain
MLSAATVDGLTYGWSGLGLAFAAVQAPMLVGMIRARARIRQMLVSPLVAVPLTAAVGIGLSLFGPQSTAAALGIGGALSVAAGYAAGRLTTAPRVDVPLHQRGARVADAAPPAAPTDQPTLAGLEIPAGDEVKHFKFIGTTGTGKSTAIGELIGPALRRGDRAVIADPDGGYLRRYYDPARGDVILNPFDLRSVKWDLFGEIRQPYDVEQLARSLVPDPESGDRTWHGYARTWLTAVTRQAHAAGVREVGELYRLLSIAPTSELRTLAAGTAAQPFLEQHNVKMFDSIRSVASSAVASLEHIAQQRGAPFSVREWIRRGPSDRGGVLFIPYRADQIAALRSSVSTWMRIAIFEAMAGPEQDQRLWFVIDELDAIGQIDGLKDALARLRKFGGRCILGFQSVAQVASTYGAGDAHTIVENCGNSLILRCSASEGGGTARFASTLIGQREVLRTTQSRSCRPDEILGAVTRSEHFSIEPAVMDSEIEQLPDLAGYLKFASRGHWLRVQLQPQSGAAALAGGVPAFVPVPPTEMPASPAVTAGTAPAANVVAIPPARRSGARTASARPSAAANTAARDKNKPTGLEL